MGCDIHCYAEIKNKESGKWEYVEEVFDCRSYGIFGFLANVRNYSSITPISLPRGLPDDCCSDILYKYHAWSAHSESWLSMDELLKFDYDQKCEDRRVTRKVSSGVISGGYTCDEGDGIIQTYKEFLGEWFFTELKNLEKLGAERIVFWFDD